MELDGKVAVVTGGGSGIGRGTALALAGAGMHLAIADLDLDSATAVAGEIRTRGARAIAVQADVAAADSVEALAEAVDAEFGAVHVLHNNAGVVQAPAPLDGVDRKDWRLVVAVNLDGVFNGIKAFGPRLKAQDGRKHIVNTASIAALTAAPTIGAYNAAKAAVFALSETLRLEMAEWDVGVSVLCPGLVKTNLLETSARQRPAGRSGLPTGQLLADEENAQVQPMDPEEVGLLVRRAIETDQPYVFTHPELKPLVEESFGRILAGFDGARRSAPVKEAAPAAPAKRGETSPSDAT